MFVLGQLVEHEHPGVLVHKGRGYTRCIFSWYVRVGEVESKSGDGKKEKRNVQGRRDDWCIYTHLLSALINPFNTAVPFWGQSTWGIERFVPKAGLRS